MSAGASPWSAGLALTLWGMAFGALPVGLQSWMVSDAPDRAEIGGGLLTAAFQVAIATGAVMGGLLVDRFGVLGAPAYCALACALGAVAVLDVRRRRRARRAAPHDRFRTIGEDFWKARHSSAEHSFTSLAPELSPERMNGFPGKRP